MSVPRLTVTLERVPVLRSYLSDARACAHDAFTCVLLLLSQIAQDFSLWDSPRSDRPHRTAKAFLLCRNRSLVVHILSLRVVASLLPPDLWLPHIPAEARDSLLLIICGLGFLEIVS